MRKGNNYSQARYLLYFLQEKGLLEAYYHAFRNNARHAPSGYETLKTILKVNDMETFQRKWEDWVLTLHFP